MNNLFKLNCYNIIIKVILKQLILRIYKLCRLKIFIN